jgi:uncharacterized protein YcbK (DUF882 family)
MSFVRSEFTCRCGCGFDTVDFELMEVLLELRSHFNTPVTITSGARCLEYNRSIGSTDRSQHPKGKAADIVVKGVEPDDVWTYLMETYPTSYGIGKYEDFTHIDVRSKKGRWGEL